MKKLFSFFVCLVALTTAVLAQEGIAPAKAGVQYGKVITSKNAISVQKLENTLKSKKQFSGKIEGEVVGVCKKKGCFLTLKREGQTDPIMVRFKDYGYFVPADLVGKTVVLEGNAKVKKLSVKQLQHNAEDAGKSAAEIAKITKPKTDINIVADGVLVVK
ncbi:DUF4920 domain-containing protein [Sphingobacterium bovistauri]|uniref:DUF4920 domain-containing protein n=1 Tax=Sphingobacterium bovistauri TaxID=2781959 RepID=A0ABS7Z4U1_9SPHI|nr:DUF4920 domain-containing protein [Sphingobacterium bovistauri]MCA5003910.1 DUF4920 domain-containing protein [Sphingobacterium bovistauri]